MGMDTTSPAHAQPQPSRMLPLRGTLRRTEVDAADYTFAAKGSVPKFAGWMAVYGQPGVPETTQQETATGEDGEEETTSGILPPLNEGDQLALSALKPEQKFTQPPARYNEGSLVKAMEENGIGRPSTYASIISVLQAREYVYKVEGRFRPTILGRRLVENLLSPVFDDILDVEYTAKMEDQLDEIEKGMVAAGSGEADAGLSRRLFGAFLTWLQEKRQEVFVVATANDLSILPPELLRKGRFDEIFFVDLPNAAEREAIWRIHLGLRKQDPKKFDLPQIVTASEGFSGSEIEQAVVAGLAVLVHGLAGMPRDAVDRIEKALTASRKPVAAGSAVLYQPTFARARRTGALSPDRLQQVRASASVSRVFSPLVEPGRDVLDFLLADLLLLLDASFGPIGAVRATGQRLYGEWLDECQVEARFAHGLLAKIEAQRKKLGLGSTSEVVRHAIAEFNLAKFESGAEERRQISVRLPAGDKVALVKAAKKAKASLGEILRAAVESLDPEQPIADAHVLYIEDSRTVAVAIRRMLEAHQMRVTHVTNAEDAIAYLEAYAGTDAAPGAAAGRRTVAVAPAWSAFHSATRRSASAFWAA